MLRKLFMAAIAAAAVLAAAPAQAQAQAQGNGTAKIGLGVAIVPLDPAIGTTVELYVPILVAPNLRVEPQVGFKTSSNDGADASDFTIGTGVFAVQKLAPAADMYFGGRIKLNFASFKPSGGSSSTGTDFEIAAAAGGEYYLAPKFSIGLEGQLGFYAQSKESNAAAGGGGLSTTGFFTNGLAFFRMYF